MSDFDRRHMKILTNSANFTASLSTLFYADSNEKSVLRHKLRQILADSQCDDAIDLGAGPGLVAEVLQQHAKNLTLVEITSEYYDDLKKKFPQARIEIQSILDFRFSQQYDLMLLSHVLYYIAVDEWENILKKLYANLAPGGKLILVHAPCHHIHYLFNASLAPNFAYMNEKAIHSLMERIGPYTTDHYLSVSYYSDNPTHVFAKKFASYFFGISDESLFENCQNELDQLLALFSNENNKLSLEFHSDIYLFHKPV